MKKLLLACVVFCLVCALVLASGKKEDSDGFSVLVYVTGVTAGSPSYELMVLGAQDFAAEHEDVTIKVYEAGYNQAEWLSQLADLIANGSYSVVVASNPALTDICSELSVRFPSQKFIITDAYLEGNDSIRSYLFNQYEQALVLGYLAGLITVSDLSDANPEKKIGFIAAQEYPLLNNHIVPGFLDGARLIDPEVELDFRVIGNWYDASKCAELARSMMASGVDVFTAIAGGADTGLFQVARENGAYIVYMNTDVYESAPGIVLGCGLMGQRELVRDALDDAYNGRTVYGQAQIVGFSDGYVGFADDSALFGQGLTEAALRQFSAFLDDIRNGRLSYTLPAL